MYTYSVYYPLCLEFLNSEKNSQFEIMKFDNSNISLKYFHFNNVYFLKEELICLVFFAIDLDLGNRCDRWSWTGSDPVHCAAGGAGPSSYE